MDARFLQDALAGGRPVGSDTAGQSLPPGHQPPSAAAKAQASEYRQLEAQLQVRDVIACATDFVSQ